MSGAATTNRRRYDLVLADHDHDGGYERPLRTILICTSRRCGSTLLGEALYRAGGLGCPLEYLHPGFRPGFADRWGTPDLDGYLRALYRYRIDATGTLGVKLFWPDLLLVYAERYPDRPEPGPGEIVELVRDLFPHPTFVYLWRQDLLRQAISDCRAVGSGRWRLFDPVDSRAVPEVTVDDVTAGLTRFAVQREHWLGFFQRWAVAPMELTYEELAADYSGTVRDVVIRLGGADPVAAAAEPRLRRQSNADTERLAVRYLSTAFGPTPTTCPER